MGRRKPRTAVAPDPAGTVDTKATRRPRKGRGGGDLGRPPIVSDQDKVTKFLNAVRAGVPIGAACDHAGIHPASHRRAIDAGAAAADQEDNPAAPTLTDRQREYRDYRAEFLRARAGVAVINVALVGKAAQGGTLISETVRRYEDDDGKMVTETTREYARPVWQAARFLLQTSFQTEFSTSQRRQVEVSGPQGGPVQVAGEEVVSAISERMRVVAERQSRELEGGWEPVEDEYGDGVSDAELVDDDADGG